MTADESQQRSSDPAYFVGTKSCITPGCTRPVKARGWCTFHYMRWYKKNKGSALIARKAPDHQPIIERLRDWTVVDEKTGCWVLTYKSTRPSATIRFNGRQRAPHRLAYEILVCPIPNKMVVDHMCENGMCWNPDHLEHVTHRVNVLRGAGHPAIRNGGMARENPGCVCWIRSAPECPIHGQLHWRENWRELLAGLEMAHA